MGTGYLFDGDYPEAYDDNLDYLRSLLRRQLDELEKNDLAQDAATIGFLRGRRSSRRNLVQIGIAHLDPPRVLVASGEVILAAADLSNPGWRTSYRRPDTRTPAEAPDGSRGW